MAKSPKQPDTFDVVGYAFPENERVKFPQQAKIFDGYKEMSVSDILNDSTIEAVIVETEEIYLTKYALMVANAGKHLHMEKPGGVDFVAFNKLVEELRTKKLTLSMGAGCFDVSGCLRTAPRCARESTL